MFEPSLHLLLDNLFSESERQRGRKPNFEKNESTEITTFRKYEHGVTTMACSCQYQYDAPESLGLPCILARVPQTSDNIMARTHTRDVNASAHRKACRSYRKFDVTFFAHKWKLKKICNV